MSQPPQHQPEQSHASGPPPGAMPPGAGARHPGSPYPPGPTPPGPPPPGPTPPPGPGQPHGQVWYPGVPAAPRSATLAAVAQCAAVVLIALGLSIPFDSTMAWATYTAWSVFAIVAALVQLAPLFGRAAHSRPGTSWTVGAAGTAALIGYWVLVALPGVTSNQGFVVTLGVAAAAAGCWFTPGRRW